MKRNITTEAVVLQSRRYLDLHRTLSLFSEDFGTIYVVAFGARKGKFAGKIEQFSSGLFHLYYNPVSQQYSLVDVESDNDGTQIRDTLTTTYHAAFMAEVTLKIARGESQAHFALLKEAYAALQARRNTDLVLIQYLWRFIAVAGLAPDLCICPICEKRYQADELLYFNNALLSPCCQHCQDGEANNQQLLLGPGARHYLQFTSELSFPHAIEVQLSEVAMKRMKRYFVRYVATIGGFELKSLTWVME